MRDKFTFNVRENYQKPYPITCSAFLNLVLQGYDYQHSTYARDTNERIDLTAYVYPPHQAYSVVRWFFANGDVWLNETNEFKRGDLLAYSKQEPEGEGTSGKYFANVYHVAMYYGKDAQGNDWVIDSYGIASGAGVTVHKMGESGRDYLGDAPQLPARRQLTVSVLPIKKAYARAWAFCFCNASWLCRAQFEAA